MRGWPTSANGSPRRFPTASRWRGAKRGEFLMANGRAATLEPHDPLAGEAYLAIGEIVGRAAAARVVAAAPLTLGADRGGRRRRDRNARGDGVRPRLRLAARAPSPKARRADARGRRAQPAGRRGEARRAGARDSRSRARAPAVDQGAGAMARAGRFPAPRRGRVLARPWRRRARRFARLARAVPARQDAARRIFQRRTRPGAARAAALRPGAPAGGRGAEPLCRADRHGGAGRLRSPRAARASRCGCRSCSAFPSIPRSPAAACR